MKLAKEFLTVPEPLPIPKLESRDLIREFLANLDQPIELPEQLEEFFRSIFKLSPYLKDCAFRNADFLIELLQSGFTNAAENLMEAVKSLGLTAVSEAECMAALRINKQRMALLCGLADLGKWWSGEKATKTLSDFANASLATSLDFILIQQHHAGKLELMNPERPQENCGLIVIGMGKLGAGELNYSSDIDLILFYEYAEGMRLNTDDPITLLSRMARQFIKIMQERTPDGYVFRMDLRLRPDPSSTPLVLPVDAALNYYEGQGQNWERAAMIKARAVAGDIKAGEQVLAELSPFIWRKYLDFAAINDIHSIKRQIHAHKGHGEIRVLGHNVKLGRGGIREIEFFVQTQQLIAGGRNLSLRTNKTIGALEELAKLGWIEDQAVSELTHAYWFLRDVEHRLQMISDEQTHTLPVKEKELLVIAQMCGFANTKTFSNKIIEILKVVSRHYEDLFESSQNLASDEGSLVFTGDDADPDTLVTLEKLGYKNPESIIKVIKHWHTAKLPALRATKAREMLTELVPVLLKNFGRSDNPDETLRLFDRFISGLPAGIQLFSILQNNPALAGLILKLLTSAPRLAEQISQQPHVFDAMLDPDFANDETNHEQLLDRLTKMIDRAPDYESALDVGRRFYHEASFLYGCRYFSGIFSLEQVKQAFSTLGDVMVAGMYHCVTVEFEKRHGKVSGAQVCILGMGRLGSRELTATSDLDLIFLYDFDENQDASDGEKPLPVQLYFTRLMQRFIAAMSSPTSEGLIYNLDFRLRPSGNAGPLATHVEGFFKYQKQEAWVWEAQALTRARPIVGDAKIMNRIHGEIPTILQGFAARDDIKSEVTKMRALIEKEKSSKNIWDVKTGEGGLLDIEFLAQYFTILGFSKNALSTQEVIASIDDSTIEENQKKTLLNALKLYEGILHLQRICLGENADIETAPAGFKLAIAELFDLPDLSACKAHLAEVQTQVRKIFNAALK